VQGVSGSPRLCLVPSQRSLGPLGVGRRHGGEG
jgi:hypothetical protein